jgi:hypothetical protein
VGTGLFAGWYYYYRDEPKPAPSVKKPPPKVPPKPTAKPPRR